MGSATNSHIVGRNQEFFVNMETVPGTFDAPAATDAMAVLTTGMSPKIARKDRKDAYLVSRDVVERITGKSEYSWAVDGYYVPSGTKNVAPPCGPFLKALLGAESVNANDVTYSQSSSQTLQTLTLVRFFQDKYMEAMWGCIVDAMTIKFSGGDEPKIHFEGRAMGYQPTGFSTLDGAMVATDIMKVAATDDYGFGINSVVKVDTEDGTGDLGLQVSVESTRPSFKLIMASGGGVVSISADSGKVVAPHVPTWTDVGVPMAGITGSLTWDNLDISALVTGFELSVKSGNKYLDDVAFQQDIDDAIPGFFEITGKVDCRLRTDLLVKLLDRSAFATAALAVVAGTAVELGTRVEIDAAQCELEYDDVTVPESEEATVSLPLRMLGSATGNDAIVWKHT